MPLRDHFRPPVDRRHAWPGLHSAWPMHMIQRLNLLMPENYVAEPHAYLGGVAEVDVGAFEDDSTKVEGAEPSGGTAVVAMTRVSPTFSVATDLASLPDFEILIYDLDRARQLVAAIEIVSPANKDRPDHRRAFVAKWSGMLQRQVCVVVIDPVTIRQFNLYAELLGSAGLTDPSVNGEPPSIYAVSTRIFQANPAPRWDAWHYPLAVGQSLPTMPLWLTEDLCVPLELESSYEEACRTLRVT